MNNYTVHNFQTGEIIEAAPVNEMDAQIKQNADDIDDLKANKSNKTETVSTVEYDTTNKKLTKTINGTKTDVVAASKLKEDMALDKVENKTSAEIRGEMTAQDVEDALGYTPMNQALKGANNGVAELGSDGKVPSSQLPSYVDDVQEFDTIDPSAWDEWVGGESYAVGDLVKITSGGTVTGYVCEVANSSATFDPTEWREATVFPLIGESGKIYVATDTNKSYRWSGTTYITIASDLALGETEKTAYRGDRGKAAYDHSQAKGNEYASGFYKVQTNAEGHVTGATPVTKQDVTDLGIPGDISGKADKVAGGTEDNFAALDANGNLKDSGHKHSDYLTQHQDISGKADKDTDAVTGNFAEFDANGNPVDSGHKHSDYITQHQDISGKADKDTDAVEGNFAKFDANGNPVDSGHKHSDYITQHQDISGKADKDTDAVTGNFAEFDANGNPVDSGHKHSDYITQHQDISGKADKDTDAVEGNFAAFDANGNPVDSGHKHSDYLTEHQDISGKLDASEKGANNGVAELDATGKVPSNQLPSYVDDVLEYDTKDPAAWNEWVAGDTYAIGDEVKVTDGNDVTGYICIKANSSSTIEDNEWEEATVFPASGEGGKIYIAKDTNLTYRWSGSVYVSIASDLALGETSSTAYRGDRGKAAYDHAQAKGNQYTSGLYKIQTNGEGHVTGATPVQKSDITDLGIPGSQPDITGKADKVTGGTENNFAGLDANGNLKDSGKKAGDFIASSEKGANNGVATLGADGKVPAAQLPAGQTTVSKIKMNNQEAPMDSSGVVDLGTVVTQHQDISGKADKDDDAVTGNFAEFDANGNPVDSGHKHSDYLTAHQDISGKADKDTDAVAGNFAEFDANGNPVDSGHKHSDYLTAHQDISGKADKASGATSGHLAGLDGNGNLTDSGKAPADLVDVLEYDTRSVSSWDEWVAGDTYAVGDTVKVTTTSSGSTVITGYICIVANSSSSILPEEWREATIFPVSGTTGKIYVDKLLNETYRWDADGSVYVKIGGGGGGSDPGYAGYVDLPVTIAVSDWTGNGPYTYTFTDSAISSTSEIDVRFGSTVRDTDVEDIEWTHTNANVVFSTAVKPSTSVPFVVRVINATRYPDASDVTSEAISGINNVEDALTELNKDFTGATSQAAGKHGLVPAPTVADKDKYLKGDGSWGVVDSNDFTGATAQAAGTHGFVPAPAAGDQGKFLKGDGTWANVPDPQTMTGATASTAGTGGLVPAPSAGDQAKVLSGDGTWKESPGAKVYVKSVTVTNTSGSYTHTFEDENISADMKAIELEVPNPYVFGNVITVTPGDGYVTVACTDVCGTDTIKISLLKTFTDPTAMTSTEFTILNNRLTAIENVYVDTAITIATSDWTLSNGVYEYTWQSAYITNKCAIEVKPAEGAEEAGIESFDCDKVTGGIKFTSDVLPTGALPVTIRIMGVRAQDLQEISGEDVTTSVITGASNVDEALTVLNSKTNNWTLLESSLASSFSVALPSSCSELLLVATSSTWVCPVPLVLSRFMIETIGVSQNKQYDWGDSGPSGIRIRMTFTTTGISSLVVHYGNTTVVSTEVTISAYGH